MRFEELLSPTTEQEFFDEIIGQDYRLFEAPASDRFSDVFDWPDLNDIVRDRPAPYPHLRLVDANGAVPERDYRRSAHSAAGFTELIPARLYDLMSSGATLIIDAVDQMHGRVRRLAREIDGSLRERVQVNVFASLGGTVGLRPHWDDVDVLVLQVSGVKSWDVFGPSRAYPLYRDVDPNTVPPPTPVARLDVGPGQVLYVPRGWWHSVSTPSGMPSLHLAVGINRRTGIDFMTWLTDRLRAEEIFRRDLRNPHLTRSGGDEMPLLRAALLKALDEPDILESFFRHEDSAALARPEYRLPHASDGLQRQSTNDVSVAWLAPRARLSVQADGLQLAADGRVWRFLPPVRPLLEELMGRREVRLEDARRIGRRASLSPSDVDLLLADLLRSGLLSVVTARERDQSSDHPTGAHLDESGENRILGPDPGADRGRSRSSLQGDDST